MPIGCVTSGVYVMAELNLGRLGHQEKPISQEKLWKKEKKKKTFIKDGENDKILRQIHFRKKNN